MSKRPNSDQPATAKRARKASGFRLARSTDSVQSTSSSSSRFVTLSENPSAWGTLRGRNRLLHRTSEQSSSSKSISNDAEPQVSDPNLGLQEAAHEEFPPDTSNDVQPDTSHAEHTQGESKRKRHTKTYVSDFSL
jgi:hypothetical protein